MYFEKSYQFIAVGRSQLLNSLSKLACHFPSSPPSHVGDIHRQLSLIIKSECFALIILDCYRAPLAMEQAYFPNRRHPTNLHISSASTVYTPAPDLHGPPFSPPPRARPSIAFPSPMCATYPSSRPPAPAVQALSPTAPRPSKDLCASSKTSQPTSGLRTTRPSAAASSPPWPSSSRRKQ